MAIPLDTFLRALDAVAPLQLAADWDKTGLLIEPVTERPISNALCTIDLTEDVLDEALERSCEAIIAYHPLIFAPLKGLRASRPEERTALRAATEGIAVYSQHTAWDAVVGGATDWLCDGIVEAFPGTESERIAIEPVADQPEPTGHGRVLTLASSRSFEEITEAIKQHLGLDRLRVSQCGTQRVSRLAVCPGAGSSVLAAVNDCDLWWTGEMRHHDVLAAKSRGLHVVLSEHSLTERGSLVRFAERLRQIEPDLEVSVSERDADPLSWI